MPVHDNIQTKADLIEKYNLGAPDVAPEQPAVTLDDQGNRNVYLGSRRIMSISNDGTITHYINGMPVMAEKLLESGELYHFRTYRQHGELLEMLNEHGETIGWEILGLDDRIIRRFDAYGRPIFNLVDVDGVYWQHDLVNNVWKRLENGIPAEERFGSINGPVVIYWQRGSHFGKEGLWKIEKDWDGEKVVDMLYTLYNSTATEDYETYHRKGYLVEKKTWEKGKGLVLDEIFRDRLDFTRYGPFGSKAEGDIYHGEQIARWIPEYNGSKLLTARQDYKDDEFYDERIYDINGNIDKILRKKVLTGEVAAILEDRIYFSEVENMTVSELADFFGLINDGGEFLYDWIQRMKVVGKGSASLMGIFDPNNKRELTAFNENNQLLFTIALLGYTDLSNPKFSMPKPAQQIPSPSPEPINDDSPLDEFIFEEIIEPIIDEPIIEEPPIVEEPVLEEPISEAEETQPESILDRLSKFFSRFLPK